MSALDTLHADLDFDRWKPDLQKIAGVWASIETLQRKAKDAKSLKAYRSYLERCIANLQANDLELSDADATVRAEEWLALCSTRRAQLQDRVAARGVACVEDWCATWLPEVQTAFMAAMMTVVSSPTKRTFDALMTATTKMFDEFENAV